MNLRLIEIKKKPDNFLTIIFYEKKIQEPTYGKNLDKSEKENKFFSLLYFKKKYLIYSPPAIFYRYAGFIGMVKRPIRIKKEQIKNQLNINKFIKLNKIDNLHVKEIWFGNSFWQKYLIKNYPSSSLVRFDHGLTETLMYFINEKTFLNFFKKYLKMTLNYFYSLFFIVPPIEKESDVHFTVNAKHINSALDHQTVKMLSCSPIKKNFLPHCDNFKKIKNKPHLAIILLENIKPWAKSKLDHEEYFFNFETMLINRSVTKLKKLGIKTLVFKSKHWHEEYSEEAIKSFDRLNNFFELKYFSDYYDNYPLEYFLKTLNPKVIIGNLSSGLYFAKHIIPNVKTYTYHDWFIDYTTKKFGATYPDFRYLNEILFEREVKHFQSLNPRKL